jgi:hypothetical protein
MFCVSGKEISDKLRHCSFNQTLKNHILGNPCVYTTRSCDIMFHQSLKYRIKNDVFELNCDYPISTDISYM